MNKVEVHGMLRYMQPHERFLVVDEITVESWFDVLSAKPDLDAKWVQAWLRDFYAVNAGGVSASAILKAWGEHCSASYWDARDSQAAIEVASDEVRAEAIEKIRRVLQEVGRNVE